MSLVELAMHAGEPSGDELASIADTIANIAMIVSFPGVGLSVYNVIPVDPVLLLALGGWLLAAASRLDMAAFKRGAT